MDADAPSSRQAAPAPGGAVEPANRAPVAIAKFQSPVAETGERYELRDPFAEVTYRSNTFSEMVAKAEQLGSSRFVAVAEDGKRTPIQRIDGQWHRDEHRPRAQPSMPDRPSGPGTSREDEPVPSASPPGRSGASTLSDRVDAGTVAKLDAKAERAALVARLEAALKDRYIIKRAPVTVGEMTIGRTEYRFRGDTSRIAFTESTFRLATDTNSPSVARSMVDVAEARNWKALRVSGSEDFRRMIWLEASARGVRTVGYEPNPADLDLLKREREARLVNRIEPARDAEVGATASAADKASARGNGGRKAVLAAIEAVLVARNVPEERRAAVMAAATEKLAQRIRDGRTPRVKIYDKSAPSQRPVVVSAPEVQRSRERIVPTPGR